MRQHLLLALLAHAARCFVYTYEPSDGLHRVKRQSKSPPPLPLEAVDWNTWSGGHLDKEDPGIQDRSEDVDWKDAEEAYIKHDYYSKLKIDASTNSSLFEQFWHDLHDDHTSDEHPVQTIHIGSRKPDSAHEPEELKDSYRRAVAVPITFDFPFYDLPTRNITIATGGFLYIGENTHSWLAATQYIAPLMANFDTNDSQATILYEDLKDRFIVQWQDVFLHNADNSTANRFTFQATLWKNGSIWFVYKTVPVPVASIADTHHPRKVGLSDAYLETPEGSNKRIIHEYHRIEIKPEDVKTGFIYLIDPLETCVSQKSCEECIDFEFKNDTCFWCANEGALGSFCSDREGKHRLHETFKRECKDRPLDKTGSDDSQYCPAQTSAPVTDKPRTLPPPKKPRNPKNPEVKAVKIGDTSSGGSGGTLFLVIVIVLFVSAAAWVGYAYFNPMTPSGQCLIRYRPSRWRMPNSDVRYTASVHM